MDKPVIRVDGWTPQRRETFLAAIGRRASVIAAARAADMSRESAYRLRRRDPAFATAWDGRIIASARRDGIKAQARQAARVLRVTDGFDRWLIRRLGGARARAATQRAGAVETIDDLT